MKRFLGLLLPVVMWTSLAGQAFPVAFAEIDRGLDAMQQLRTLMPERLWVQEFSILVKRKAFQDHLTKLMNRRWTDPSIKPSYVLAQADYYFLKSTMSGEFAQITDIYQEFEESPFWKNPLMVASLKQMEKAELAIPCQTAPAAVSGGETVSSPDCEPLTSSLKGILILGCWDKVRKEPVDEIDGVVVDGVCLLEQGPFLCQLSRDFLCKPLTRQGICEIKERIAAYYRSHHQPLAVVSIPVQELNRCVLQVVVDEAKLGEVRTMGNCYFSSRWLKEEIRTKPGEVISGQQMLEDIAWLNLSPFRRTDAIYMPGKKPGTTDVELVSIDRWPYRFYAGADNTGTGPTDRDRFFFGFNFGKSVLKDGQISYQFTCAPNWNRFFAHTASARLPLPTRDILVFWGGYTQVEPESGVRELKNKGYSWQVDGRYRFPFLYSPGLMQEFVIGYDFKETNNNLHFAGSEIFHSTADISQFMTGYELGWRDPKQRLTLQAEVYGNPVQITHNNQNRYYRQLRYDAKSRYIYFKAFHSYARNFKWCWLTYNLTGQVASANLLPSEQLTLTGNNAVRGYEERVLNRDNGLIVNVGWETPRFSPMKYWNVCKFRDELYFYGFFDYGLGANHKAAPGEAKFCQLASVGPGVRYQMDRYLTARFDYGFQLWHHGFDNPTHSRYNFGFILSY